MKFQTHHWPSSPPIPYNYYNSKFFLQYFKEIHFGLFTNSRAIGLISWVSANGPGVQGSITGWVIPKTQKMVLDAILLNTQHYKVHIKGKVEQSRERSSALALKLLKGKPSGHPQLRSPTLHYLWIVTQPQGNQLVTDMKSTQKVSSLVYLGQWNLSPLQSTLLEYSYTFQFSKQYANSSFGINLLVTFSLIISLVYEW